MDPVIATLTAAVAVLACEVSKGIASAAGSDIWTRIKSLLGFSKEPELAELAPKDRSSNKCRSYARQSVGGR